jgi:hypothetical protein
VSWYVTRELQWLRLCVYVFTMGLAFMCLVSHNCFYYTSKPECAIPDDNMCLFSSTSNRVPLPGMVCLLGVLSRSLSLIIYLSTSYRKAHALPPSCLDYYNETSVLQGVVLGALVGAGVGARVEAFSQSHGSVSSRYTCICAEYYQPRGMGLTYTRIYLYAYVCICVLSYMYFTYLCCLYGKNGSIMMYAFMPLCVYEGGSFMRVVY